MISLQDKIQKFEKMIYNKELDDFIPIDDQFIGGGITMESLIKENAFVVEQIKKMKSVFINYCKLNQSVYQKITEHELSLHAQSTKMSNLTNAVDIKMNESIKQVKQMYEQMQYQSLKTKNLVQDAVKPIEQAIKLKVDESSFSKQMKKILQEIDDQQGQRNQNQSYIAGQTEQTGMKRKRGKPVYSQEYLFQKQKTAKLILQLSRKVQDIDNRNGQCEILLYKNTSQINVLNQSNDTHQSEIYKINKENKQIKTFMNSSQKMLMEQIKNRTNDSVWQTKFKTFQILSVTPRVQFLLKKFEQSQKESNKKFNNLEPRFIQIFENIQSVRLKAQDNQQQIYETKQYLQKTNTKITDEIIIIEQKLKQLYKEKKVKIEKVTQKIDHQIISRKSDILNLNQTIKNLAKVIEEKVALGVKKNIELKIHQIDDNIHRLSAKASHMQQQISKQNGQIYNIKQILSRKANFSDILMHFQRKADKQDFKQLRDKIQTSPSYLKSTIMDSPQKTRRTISSNSRRPSHSKNLINPVNITNFDKESLQSDNQETSRLFIMGLQNDLPYRADKRRLSLTQSTRRGKKMKSTTGMLNMFA